MSRLILPLAALFVLLPALAGPARAQLAVDRLILEFEAGGQRRQDVEVSNQGDERMFVTVEPRIVNDPGTDQESRETMQNPEALGLLVTPNRMILEPGQTRLLRIAPLPRQTDTDRIYRVSVRPVVGRLDPNRSGVRVVVGYQLLVIIRPPGAEADIRASRDGRTITFTNRGNSNALLFNGRQCNSEGAGCVDLPARRLYAGNSWTLTTRYTTPVQYYVQFKGRSTVRQY